MQVKAYVLVVEKNEMDFLRNLLGEMTKEDCDRLLGEGHWVMNDKLYDGLDSVLDDVPADD